MNENKVRWSNLSSLIEKVFSTLHGIKYLTIYDVETTGLSIHSDKIIQLSAIKVKMSYENDLLFFTEVGRFNELINPFPKLISEKITELTGISQNDVLDKPGEGEIIPQFIEFANDSVLVGQNVRFDNGMLSNALVRLGIPYPINSIDTLELSRALLHDIENHKLKTIAEYFGVVPENAAFHNAMFDVEMTMLICERLLNLLLQCEPSNGYIQPRIISLSEFSKGKVVHRTYIQTNKGSLYYDRLTHSWGAGTKKDPLDISMFDMEFVESQVNNVLLKNGIDDICKVHSTIYA